MLLQDKMLQQDKKKEKYLEYAKSMAFRKELMPCFFIYIIFEKVIRLHEILNDYPRNYLYKF